MKKRHQHKTILLFTLLMAFLQSRTQNNFVYKSNLEEIKQDGFYKIALPPHIVAKCNENMSDVRILDNKGNQVPYILKSGLHSSREKSRTELPDLSLNGSYIPVPSPTCIQWDSTDKASYISVQFNDDYRIDRLELLVKGTKLFSRKLIIKNGYSRPSISISTQLLRSDAPTSYQVGIKTKKINLVIQNEDNPPLRIAGVKAYQLNMYLLSYLESANRYQLVFGNTSVKAPRYDLESFKDSIGNKATMLTAGPVGKNYNVSAHENETVNYKNKWVLWTVILGVLVLLLTLTLRMAKKVNNKNDI